MRKRLVLLFTGFLMLAFGLMFLAMPPAPDAQSAQNAGAVLIVAAISVILLLELASR